MAATRRLLDGEAIVSHTIRRAYRRFYKVPQQMRVVGIAFDGHHRHSKTASYTTTVSIFKTVTLD